MADSILDDVKHVLGIEPEYTQFDIDILMHINSVFAVIHQIGAGPQTEVFAIEDKTQTWADFIGDKTQINFVKSYVCAKVKLMFDPPNSSFGLSALQETIKEYESRLNYLEPLFVVPVTP